MGIIVSFFEIFPATTEIFVRQNAPVYVTSFIRFIRQTPPFVRVYRETRRNEVNVRLRFEIVVHARVTGINKDIGRCFFSIEKISCSEEPKEILTQLSKRYVGSN